MGHAFCTIICTLMQVIMKANESTSIEDRCRMNILALAAVTLSQVCLQHSLSMLPKSGNLVRMSPSPSTCTNYLTSAYELIQEIAEQCISVCKFAQWFVSSGDPQWCVCVDEQERFAYASHLSQAYSKQHATG